MKTIYTITGIIAGSFICGLGTDVGLQSINTLGAGIMVASIVYGVVCAFDS